MLDEDDTMERSPPLQSHSDAIESPPAAAPPLLDPPPAPASNGTPDAPAVDSDAAAPTRTYRQKIAAFVDGLTDKREKKPEPESDPGILETFALSLDVVQETITRFRLAAQPPDLVIPVPRNACAFYEFHRAEELIELGRARARAALGHFQPRRRRGSLR